MNPVGRAFIKLHTWLLRKTKGQRFNMGGRLLVLNTVGAKSGKARANPLMYMHHDNGWIIAASAAGADKSPGWWHNLKKSSSPVTIELDGETFGVDVRLIAGGEERDQIYQQLAEMEPRFAGYAAKTSRVIPLAHLTRKG